jgi:uncharacterized OB-fold protein
VFLAEIGKRRIVGSRFADGDVIAPAQDFSPVNGESDPVLVLVPETGELRGFTRVDGAVLALIQLDGCANSFVHRLTDADLDGLKVGSRLRAVWDDAVQGSILAISGFAVDADAEIGQVAELPEHEAPVEVVPYDIRLQYEHSYGPYYGRLFDEIKTNRVIMGVRTSDGDAALLPPREIDDLTHRRTGTWKACKDTGTIRGCSIINLEFVGQTRPPPYVYAEIVLDGASTRLIHMIEIDSVEDAKQRIKPGTRVRAIWGNERTGSLADIERFEVIDE